MIELDCDLTVGIATSQTNEDKAAKLHFVQTGSKKGKRIVKKLLFQGGILHPPMT